MIKIKVFCLLCMTMFFAGTILERNSFGNHHSQAESILIDFLHSREEGNFEKCMRFLTEKFKSEFQKSYGYDFITYFRNQNEDYYKRPKIVSFSKKDEQTVVFNVEVDVEGPGYHTKADETYILILEKDGWKIDNWKIYFKKNN